MKLLALVALLTLLGTVSAYQNLSSGEFLYNNVTLGSGSSIYAGIDASGSMQLIVIKSSDFSSWVNGGHVNELFRSTVGSGVYQINLTSGSYTVIFSASSSVSADAEAFGARRGAVMAARISNSYQYNLTLDNYSSVNVSILTDRDFGAHPITVNVSGFSYSLDNGDNFDSLYNIQLNKGTYPIVITSSLPTDAFIMITSYGSVINPQQGFGGSYPVGVVSYGVYNSSGVLVPYVISTGGAIGDANITSLSAMDFNSSDNNSAYGASLQLNVELNTRINGQPRVLWLQNVVDFNTSQKSYYLVSNIWNNTLPSGNLSNSMLRGSGNVTVCGPCGNQSFYAYSYPYDYFNYSLPFNIKLVILENQTINGTLLSFGYQVLENGSYGRGPLVFYDKVLLPGAENSSILVTPYFYTPSSGNLSGNYYDAELVFAGESGGAQSYFNDLAATMWIYYYDNGTVVPFPSAYTFGQDTAETAANVRVVQSKYGNGGFATTGTLVPSEQILVGKEINTTATYIQNSSYVTSAPTTTAYERSISVSIPSIGGSGVQLSPAQIVEYFVVALVIVTILMVARLLLARR